MRHLYKILLTITVNNILFMELYCTFLLISYATVLEYTFNSFVVIKRVFGQMTGCFSRRSFLFGIHPYLPVVLSLENARVQIVYDLTGSRLYLLNE